MGTVNVVLGIVRGGLIDGMKECGGINNPTAYTRVRSLLPWIMSLIPDEERDDICFGVK